MGVGIAIGLTLATTAASIAFGFINRQSTQTDKLRPNTIEDFNVTQTKEGTAIPIIYGKVRTEGNIIWWGNLTTSEIKGKKPQGSKGGAPSGGNEGFAYRADVWQSIAFAPSGSYTIHSYFLDDKVDTPEATISINDGTGTYKPTEPGEYATKLPGVCHIFLDSFFLGENVKSIPNVHFIISRTLPETINHANMDNGNNPAAIIYDLLIAAGVSISDIDLEAFNTAADYWYSKGYGLNIKIAEQKEIVDLINDIMKYVDGAVFIDNQGRYSIRAFDKDDSSVATMEKEDFRSFSMVVNTWNDVPNDFRGSFTSQDHEFTKRIVFTQNPSAIRLSGGKKQQTVDLGAYRDQETADKRITEIMKILSFPAKTLDVEVDLSFSTLLPGDVFSVNNSDYGMSSAEFRVMSIEQPSYEENKVKIKARQMVETLFDDNFLNVEALVFSPPDIDLEELAKVRIFELPFNRITGEDPAVLILAAREKGIETGFTVLASAASDGDFEQKGAFSTFSQHGTLVDAYPSTTKAIDDETGILFTPYKPNEDLFDTLSRADLFHVMRFAIINDEIIAFQSATLEGENVRLLGCIRGALGTEVASHSSSDEIWLVNFGQNLLQENFPRTLYFQVLPTFGRRSLDPPVTNSTITFEQKAKKPYSPGRVKATRSGSNIDIEIWPRTPGLTGSGTDPAENVTDQYPFEFEGDFEINDGTTSTFVSTTETSITKAGAFTLSVKSRRNGFLSSAVTVSVGASDGDYYG